MSEGSENQGDKQDKADEKRGRILLCVCNR